MSLWIHNKIKIESEALPIAAEYLRGWNFKFVHKRIHEWLTEPFDLPQIHPESLGNGVFDVPNLKFSRESMPRTRLACLTFSAHKFEPSFAKSWIHPTWSSLKVLILGM